MEREHETREELLRTRRRLHELEGAVAGLRYELKAALDFCKRYGPLIDGMAEADRIAAGVAEALRRRGSAQFTFLQKLTAALVAATAVAGVVLQAVYH